MNYYIIVGNYADYTNRALSANYNNIGIKVDKIPWSIDENPWDYHYINNTFIYEPIEENELPGGSV